MTQFWKKKRKKFYKNKKISLIKTHFGIRNYQIKFIKKNYDKKNN